MGALDIVDAVVKEATLYLTSQYGVVKLGAIGICRVHCDLSIPDQKYAKEQAFLQPVN
jgi:hypothetical protein